VHFRSAPPGPPGLPGKRRTGPVIESVGPVQRILADAVDVAIGLLTALRQFLTDAVAFLFQRLLGDGLAGDRRHKQ